MYICIYTIYDYIHETDTPAVVAYVYVYIYVYMYIYMYIYIYIDSRTELIGCIHPILAFLTFAVGDTTSDNFAGTNN